MNHNLTNTSILDNTDLLNRLFQAEYEALIRIDIFDELATTLYTSDKILARTDGAAFSWKKIIRQYILDYAVNTDTDGCGEHHGTLTTVQTFLQQTRLTFNTSDAHCIRTERNVKLGKADVIRKPCADFVNTKRDQLVKLGSAPLRARITKYLTPVELRFAVRAEIYRHFS